MTCGIEGCDGKYHARGFCRRHYKRLLKTGDPLGFMPRPVARRIMVKCVGHPLANSVGNVRRARLVLYDKLAGCDPACYWCDRPLRWLSMAEARSASDAVCADHLNEDTQDDRPENLVPSCRGCNGLRAVKARPIPAFLVEKQRAMVL